jgi:hypothetical protein
VIKKRLNFPWGSSWWICCNPIQFAVPCFLIFPIGALRVARENRCIRECCPCMPINHSLSWWFFSKGTLWIVSFPLGSILWGLIFLSNFHYRWGKAYYSLLHFNSYSFVRNCLKQYPCYSKFRFSYRKSSIFWSNVRVKKLIFSSLFQITRILTSTMLSVFRGSSLYH